MHQMTDTPLSVDYQCILDYKKMNFWCVFFQPACPPGYVCHDGHCDRGELRYYDLLHVSSGPRMVKSITIYSHSLVQYVVNSLPRHNSFYKV